VRVEGELASPARVRFSYVIARAADGTLLVTGHTVHATIDRDGRPCRLPERVRSLFA
jgi:acyl-CoA thioesterase FadM